MKICYFGTYIDNYSRNRIMIESLRKVGAYVFECHEVLWKSIDQRVNLVKFGPNCDFIRQVVKTTLSLVIKYFRLCRNCDLILVGYPGHFDIFLAWFLAKLTKKPLVLDFFMSLYLISKERKLDESNKVMVSLLNYVERVGVRLPNFIIQDTVEYKEWLVRNYNLKPQKIIIIPTGANDNIFKREKYCNKERNEFIVLYYGTYIPNHGTSVIIEAAKLLKNYPDIKFIMVGKGPDLRICKQLVSEYHLVNVEFIDWLEQNELTKLICMADVCLGAFGQTPQSLMTIHNKIYECLAMGKAVITGISPATERVFTNYHDIFLCDRTPTGLADAIKTLYLDPTLKMKLAENGYRVFLEKFSTEKIGQMLLSNLRVKIYKMGEGTL